MGNWQKHIISNPNVLGGKPTIKGTRLSVEFILERLGNGWTEATLLENYPRLTQADLHAVHAYLTHVTWKAPEVRPVGSN